MTVSSVGASALCIAFHLLRRHHLRADRIVESFLAGQGAAVAFNLLSSALTPVGPSHPVVLQPYVALSGIVVGWFSLHSLWRCFRALSVPKQGRGRSAGSSSRAPETRPRSRLKHLDRERLVVMSRDEALAELLATAEAGEAEMVRAWRDRANKCWKVSGTVGLTGGNPTVILTDSEIPKSDLRRLLLLIGET